MEKTTIAEMVLEGTVSLDDVCGLKESHIQLLDLSKAQWGYEEEYWEQCLGYSHCGPIYGNSGYRQVEVLLRLLETADADVVVLPDDVMRRHINRISSNRNIRVAKVGPECKLFSMKGDVLMNKKGTKEVYNPDTKKS